MSSSRSVDFFDRQFERQIHQDFAAPGNTVKWFATIVARKP